MNALKRKYSILIVEEDSDFQFLFKVAVSELDPEIGIEIVYNGDQMLELLLRDKIQRALNRQLLPNLIIGSNKTAILDSPHLKELRKHEKFYNVPVFLLDAKFDAKNREILKAAGANEVFKRPDTFHDLKKLISELISQNQPKRLTKGLFCCRCEEYIEFFPERVPLGEQLKISEKEAAFIRPKFAGALCIPCLRQLKTAYRIINGEYEDESKIFHSSN